MNEMTEYYLYIYDLLH